MRVGTQAGRWLEENGEWCIRALWKECRQMAVGEKAALRRCDSRGDNKCADRVKSGRFYSPQVEYEPSRELVSEVKSCDMINTV